MIANIYIARQQINGHPLFIGWIAEARVGTALGLYLNFYLLGICAEGQDYSGTFIVNLQFGLKVIVPLYLARLKNRWLQLTAGIHGIEFKAISVQVITLGNGPVKAQLAALHRNIHLVGLLDRDKTVVA